jgi:hypothetical protein
MGSIFVTYSHHDRSFATRLADDLEKLGAAIWMDVKNIPYGDKWRNSVQRALQKCDTMLVVISPESMQSDQVEAEWGYFLDNKKRIIPLVYKAADIHYQLRILQYIDFCNQAYEDALHRLGQVLQLKKSIATGMLNSSRLPQYQSKKRTSELIAVKEEMPGKEPYYFGANSTLELYILNQVKPIRINIPKERVIIIGRSVPEQSINPDVDLNYYRAAGYGVSRRHASFSSSEGKLYICDLNSTNSTQINGIPLTPHEPHPLKSGDVITFGIMKVACIFSTTRANSPMPS